MIKILAIPYIALYLICFMLFFNQLFKGLLWLLVLCSCTIIYGQSKRASQWIFANNAGIDFTQHPPAPILGGQINLPHHGSGTISDESGNLLFYTNGHSVWNKNHVLMPNGTGLTKGTVSFLSQTSVIVPKPGSANQYYIFTTNRSGANVEHGLFYATVDMSLNGGLGDVVDKNVFLQQHMNRGLTAVQHANGRDYWVIAHEWETENYLSYLVTSAGVVEPPIVSKGTIVQTWWGGWTGGQLKASPDGAWIASEAQSGIELAKFSTLNGRLTQPFIIKDPEVSYNPFRGVEFSPNSNVLYGVTLYEGILQFNLTKETPAAIIGSFSRIDAQGSNVVEDMQLAPDGNIYVGKGGGQAVGLYTIGILRNPNALGTQAILTQNGMELGGRSVHLRLPTFVTSFLAEPPTILHANICLGETTIFTPSGIGSRDSLRWTFSDPAAGNANTAKTFVGSHIFTSPGTYNVTLRVYLGPSYKDFTHQVTIIDKPIVNLGPDIKECSNKAIELDAGTGAGLTYRWSTGATTQKITVTTSGTYWVEVSNGFCTSRDEIKVTFLAQPLLSLGPDLNLCTNTPTTLSVGTNNQNYQIRWSTGATTPTITVNQTGKYWVEVANDICTARDEININYNTLNNLSISASSTTLAYNEPVTLTALGEELTSWQWTLGDETQSDASVVHHTYEFAGTYPITLTATNSYGCTATDTTRVTVAPHLFIPNIFTPNGDGFNDSFSIVYNVKGPFDIVIYDRWGNQVYKSDSKDFEWAGINASDGVYFYMITAPTGTYKGWVELVR